MKVKLRIHKGESDLLEQTYDICDAASFGNVFADVWMQMRERELASATSIGALFDALGEKLIDELHGAEISICKA